MPRRFPAGTENHRASAPHRGGAAALACAVVLALVVPASAQDKPPTPPKKNDAPGGRDRIRLSDDPPPATPPRADGPAPAAPAPAAKSDLEKLVDELATWPSAEAKQASIRLAAQPTESWPHMERILRGFDNDWRLVCAAASTVSKIGDARAIELIQARLQDRSLFLHSGDLLDAIVRLDPAGGKARLVAQLLHPASAVVEEAASRLATRVGPADVVSLRDVLEAGGPTARAAAVTLLVAADRAEARASLAAALRDPSPEVAWAAARALSTDDSPEALSMSLRCSASNADRQMAYASLSLTLRAERTATRTVDEKLLPLLLGGRGLSGLEPLNRAVAAVALADLGYYHEVAQVESILETRVVPELISIVAAREFWPDHKILLPLAQRRLQRLTGKTGIGSAQEWTSWWEQSRGTFRARRVLSDVPAEQTATFSVSLRGREAPGSESTTFAASGDALVFAAPDDVTLLMDREQSEALRDAVLRSGLLKAPEGVVVDDTSAAPLEVVVRAGRRERRIAVAGAARTEGVTTLLDAAKLVRDETSWQRWRSSAGASDLPSFVALHGAKFAPGRSAEEKAAARAELIAAAVDPRRDDAHNLRALAELSAIPSLPSALGGEAVNSLLRALGSRRTLDPVAEGIVGVLAKSGRKDVHPLLVDFLLTRPGLRSDELLADTFRAASREDLSAALKDARRPVRRAAADSLTPASPQDVADAAVRALLDDPDIDVRRAAVRALGRLKAEWARADLLVLASQPGDLRGAAVDALGSLGGKDVLPALHAAYTSDDVSLRVLAIRAMAATREPEALSAIAFAMSGDPDPAIREIASRAILDVGSDRALAELRRLALDRAQPDAARARAAGGLAALGGPDTARDLARLVDDPSETVGDEAAVSLARWRDPSGVPRLVRMLEKGRDPRRARAALESVSLEVFGQDDPAMLASLYAGWWETTKDRGPRGWLVDALTLQGIDDPSLRGWETGGSAIAAVPSMLKALDDGSWAVRRAIDLVFREAGSRTFGDIERGSTRAESDRIVAQWKDYWARRFGQ